MLVFRGVYVYVFILDDVRTIFPAWNIQNDMLCWFKSLFVCMHRIFAYSDTKWRGGLGKFSCWETQVDPRVKGLNTKYTRENVDGQVI